VNGLLSQLSRLSCLRATLLATSAIALLGSPVAAQQPTPAQIEQAMSTPGGANAIRQRIRTSGLTPEQIRQRLKAAGYSETLLDQYLSSASDTSRVAVSDSVLNAVTSLGIVDREEIAARESGLSATSMVEAPAITPAKERTKIFGLEVFRGSTSQFQPDIAGPVDANYRVGPRDVLALIITGGVETSYSLEVSREGFIVIPQVGQVFVANLTLEQVQDVLFRRLRSVYSGIGRDANASTHFYVTVVKLRTNQVFVIGEAAAPASYQVSSVGTILTALYGAGGPSDIGSLRRVELRRNGSVTSTLDVYDYLIRGDASKDARLESGDIIFVPAHGPRVEVVGEVLRPAIYELKSGETLNDLIGMAGGFTSIAGRRRVLVSRILPPAERVTAGGRDRTVLDINSDDLSTGFGPAVPLVDGDRVEIFEIASRVRNSISVLGAVWNPGSQGFEAGMRLSEALRRAGGVRPEVKDALIDRLQSDQTRRSLRAEFVDTLGTLAEDMVLQEDDTVRVYATTDFRPDRYIAISGAVQKDGRYPWREGLTLRDLVHEAGGFEDGAYLVHAEVARLPESRRPGELARTIAVPLDSGYLLERGLDGKYVGPPGVSVTSGQRPDFVLAPYDNVLILRQPEWLLERRVTINGEVRFPGTYALTSKQERMSSLIKRAGGLLPTAYPEAAAFVRSSRGVGRVGFDLRGVLADSTSRDNLILEPGDTLSVPRFVPTVQVSGAVNSPIAVAHVEGKRFKYYIDAAGGDNYLADLDRAYVRQPNGIVEPYKNRMFPIPDGNPRPLPGAEVFVPEKDPNDRKDWTAIIGSVAQVTASIVAIIVVVTR